MTAPDVDNMSYTLTTTRIYYEIPEFTVDPDYCQVTYTTTVSPELACDEVLEVIDVDSENQRDLSWFWD